VHRIKAAAVLVCVAIVAGRRTPFRPRGTAASGLVWSKRFHRAGLFAFRTLPVFDARALLIAFSAALILASRLTSGVGKFKAKFSLASARFKRSAFLVSEIGWPMLLPYRKTTPSRPLGSPDSPTDTALQLSWLATSNALVQAALSIVLMVSGEMPDFSATARSCSSITARA